MNIKRGTKINITNESVGLKIQMHTHTGYTTVGEHLPTYLSIQ